MPDWLLTIFGILMAAAVGFGFNYYLQCRLFKIQSKEKSIDMLMDALDSLQTLYVDSWERSEPHSSNRIIRDRHRFSRLATSVSEYFKFENEIKSCLKNLTDKSPSDDFNSNLSVDEDLQNELLKAFHEIHIVFMKNRYR